MIKVSFTDAFGIGPAVLALLDNYFHAARGTGRTTRLVESLKDGDCVITCTIKEARVLERLIRQRSLTVNVKVVDPKNPESLFEMGTQQGRLIFDHTWVEQRYRIAIFDTANWMDGLQQRLGGYDHRHRETRAMAESYMFKVEIK